MIDIFARIYLGILIFLSAAAIIALIVCFIAAMVITNLNSVLNVGGD